MKKYLLSLFLFGSIFSFAQKHFLAFQSGINFSNINSKIYDDTKFLSSFNSAITYDFKFKSGVLLGTALHYERQGFKKQVMYFPENMDFVSADLKSVNDYMGIPLKIGYSIGEKWNGFAYIGMQTSYLLKSKNYFSYSDLVDEKDNTDNKESFGFAGIIELGTGYWLSESMNLFLNMGYLHSFTDLCKESNIEVYNYRFSVSIGVKYAIKAKNSEYENKTKR